MESWYLLELSLPVSSHSYTVMYSRGSHGYSIEHATAAVLTATTRSETSQIERMTPLPVDVASNLSIEVPLVLHRPLALVVLPSWSCFPS